jgi:aminopeptidase N
MASLPGRRLAAPDVAGYPGTRAVFKMRGWLIATALLLVPGTAAAGSPPGPMAPDPLAYVSPSRGFATLHTSLDLDIDLEKQAIAGSVSHRVQSLRPGLNRIGFNCVELSVDSVTVDGRPARWDYPVHGGQSTSWIGSAARAVADQEIIIHLDDALARGDEAVVRIVYHGNPKIGLYWIPTEKGQPDKRLEVWSQGEGEDNRYWIPCHDYPNDKSTFEGRFRVPKGYTAVSNGALVDTRDIGNQTQFTYRLATPQVSYLIMLAVAKYRIYQETWNDVPLWYVVPPDARDEDILRDYGKTGDMMEIMSKEIGIDYPYEKYAQVVVQNFIYGGMENTTATVMNMRTLYDEREALTRSEEYLVAHELAHQWFGDMLTCREWSHMWLNEGFATYYAFVWTEQRKGDDEFRWKMYEAHGKVIASDDEDPRPMVVDFFNRSDARNNTNVYNRGASVLHMLRFLLGDEMYRTTIHEYTKRYAYQTVETPDLMRVVKEVTGENLDWFFEQWVYLAGYPRFAVKKKWDDVNNVLHLSVEQRQKTEGLVPVFRTPVDVEVTWDGGSRVQRIMVDQASQDYYLSLPSKPLMVLFDPGEWIPKPIDFPRSADELLYQLEHAGFMGRVRAATSLGDHAGDRRAVPALRGALEAGGHWGLGREAALSLGRMGTPPARDALIEGLAVKDAMVRLASAEALGNFPADKRAADALEAAINNDRAYGVRVQALSSLVKTREARASRVCVAALKQSSDRNSVRCAAIEGLAALKDPAAMDRIKGYCASGNPRDQRHAAIAAWGGLGAELAKDADRRRAAEYLYPGLDDWYLRTREASIDAIAKIGHPSSVTVLRRVASSDLLSAVRDRAAKAATRIEARQAVTDGTVTDAARIQELQKRVDALEQQLQETRKAVAPGAAAGEKDN